MLSSARIQVLAAFLILVGCGGSTGPAATTPDGDVEGTGGDGGTGGGSSGGATGGKGGAPTAGTGGGGAGGAGGAVLPDAAPVPEKDAGSPATDAAPSTPDTGAGDSGGEGGGEALLVVGAVPIIGSDITIHERLVAKGLKVTAIRDNLATAASAMGKKIVIISYSIDSEEVTGKFNDTNAAVVVMEHNLLGSLGMTATAGSGHGYAKPGTHITIIKPDHPLAAGFTGDVQIAQGGGSVFWGVPSETAVKIASMKGSPGRISLFAYEAGAMMVGKLAPGRRVQFFLGAHLEPVKYLNADGAKLLDATIDWCLR